MGYSIYFSFSLTCFIKIVRDAGSYALINQLNSNLYNHENMQQQEDEENGRTPKHLKHRQQELDVQRENMLNSVCCESTAICTGSSLRGALQRFTCTSVIHSSAHMNVFPIFQGAAGVDMGRAGGGIGNLQYAPTC